MRANAIFFIVKPKSSFYDYSLTCVCSEIHRKSPLFL